jgi:predicted lipoprotein with Yx(FWY)xxD motif
MTKVLWLVGVAGALTLTACTSSGHIADATPAGAATSQAPVSSASSSEAEASEVESGEAESGEAESSSAGAGSTRIAKVSVATTDKGNVLAGPTGHLLYTYDPDTSRKSFCLEQCAAAWPPLVGRPSAGAGVRASELGTITRPDGTTQVTYDGQPLYYFANDRDDRDARGDDLGGVWHVAKAGAGSEEMSSSSGGNGY